MSHCSLPVSVHSNVHSLTEVLIKGHLIPCPVLGQWYSPGRACVLCPANAALTLESEKPRGHECGAGAHCRPVGRPRAGTRKLLIRTARSGRWGAGGQECVQACLVSFTANQVQQSKGVALAGFHFLPARAVLTPCPSPSEPPTCLCPPHTGCSQGWHRPLCPPTASSVLAPRKCHE